MAELSDVLYGLLPRMKWIGAMAAQSDETERT